MTLIKTLVLGAFLSALGITEARAENICAKQFIQMIVSLPVGAGTEVGIRVIARKMESILAQPIAIINVPGADGQIAAQRLKSAAADGCTVGSIIAGAFTLVAAQKTVKREVQPYDVSRDFKIIGRISETVFVLAANSQVPAHSFAELMAYAKAPRAPLAFATSTPITRVAMGLLRTHYVVDAVSVPYKGDVETLSDLISGQIQVSFLGLAVALPHIRSGAVQPLAVIAPTRDPQIPEVPTYEEVGIKEIRAVMTWIGLFGPPGLPDAVAERYNAVLFQALVDPEVSQALVQQGNRPHPSSSSELEIQIREQTLGWERLFRMGVVEPR